MADFKLVWNNHEIGVGKRGDLLEYVARQYVERQGYRQVALDRWRRGNHEIRLIYVKGEPQDAA